MDPSEKKEHLISGVQKHYESEAMQVTDTSTNIS